MLPADTSIEHLPAERERSEVRANAFAEGLPMHEAALRSTVPEDGLDCYQLRGACPSTACRAPKSRNPSGVCMVAKSTNWPTR